MKSMDLRQWEMEEKAKKTGKKAVWHKKKHKDTLNIRKKQMSKYVCACSASYLFIALEWMDAQWWIYQVV